MVCTGRYLFYCHNFSSEVNNNELIASKPKGKEIQKFYLLNNLNCLVPGGKKVSRRFEATFVIAESAQTSKYVANLVIRTKL